MDKHRNYGILMPISALPSKEGIGTLGAEAYRFVEFLAASGGTIWQVLPLNPTNYGDSPYSSCAASALNYYFIDLHELVREGLLTESEVGGSYLGANPRRVDYGAQFTSKISLLRTAFSRFNRSDEGFKQFLKKGDYSEFAVFMSLKCTFNHKPFTDWDAGYRIYDQNKVNEFVRVNAFEVEFWQFTQYIFLHQWNALKAYAHSLGVKIMGDIPLYVAYDSLEVWKYGDELFKLDKNRGLKCVAGVPPDAFTDDGQLWGNPVYDWEKMKKSGYGWWNRRIANCMELFDILRIDHFRGFDRYYEIPVGEKTARNGHWSDGPKEELFKDKLHLRIVAEDLGVIDDGVRRLMKNVGYPGMKILEFAFDGTADNEHKPSNYTQNFVCYTGTHDNMPLRQYIEDLSADSLKIYKDDLKKECKLLGFEAELSSPAAMCSSIVELAFRSVAATVIIPMWDVLAFGGEARINLPSTVSDKNWSFRFEKGDFTTLTQEYLKALAQSTGRAADCAR